MNLKKAAGRLNPHHIYTADNFWLANKREQEAIAYIADLLAPEGFSGLVDCNKIVVGERNVWAWYLDRTPDGFRYINPATGFPATILNRANLGEE